MHRAELILQTIAERLVGQTPAGENVYRARYLPLDYDEGELPAILVNMGDDTLTPTQPNGFDDSELSVETRIVVRSEVVSDTALLAIRSAIQRALMADPTLGLPFVIDLRRGAAARPQIDNSGGGPIAFYDVEWTVQYRSPEDNPEV